MKSKTINVADAVRQMLFGRGIVGSVANNYSLNGNGNSEMENESNGVCACLNQLSKICIGQNVFVAGHAGIKQHFSPASFNSDVGRMLYTISILLMFSLVILLLMFRSIRRSRSAVEIETLMDAMRFREELDLQWRQKKRLRKAKKKVTAWLCRGNGAKMWQSSPHILLPSNPSLATPIRTNSIQSSGSFIPEIIISEHLPPGPCSNMDLPEIFRGIERQNSCTPSLSLIYDFSSRRNSQVPSQASSSADPAEESEANIHQFSQSSESIKKQEELPACEGTLQRAEK